MKVSEWITALKQKKNVRQYIRAVEKFGKLYGMDREVGVYRVPSRINLKGVHIEHRGGYVNYMSIDREAVFVVSPREDGLVVADNVEHKYPQRQFDIDTELPENLRGDWLNYISLINIIPGDWGNYIRAGVLCLQNRFPNKKFKGMDIVVLNNIPVDAGLSAFSALVVGSAIACMGINKLELSLTELVELCGMGEWYVGTRGGAGDHAAMLCGKKGKLLHTRFFPLTVEPVELPGDYAVIMCNSFRESNKSQNAKSVFNERVATNVVALMIIKRLYPEKTVKFKYFRDIEEEPVKWVYEMLKRLPERISREELRRLFSAQEEIKVLEKLFSTHNNPPEGYAVRKVCLFGLAECQRGKLCINYLSNNNIHIFGEMMYLSHDGDRVVTHTAAGRVMKYDNNVSAEYLDGLIAKINVGEDDTAALWRQPGGYGCSCEELDFIVDTAKKVKGVVGASLTGGGLGGCVLVLVHKDSVKELINNMNEKYYIPRKLGDGCELCVTADGAGKVSI